MIKKKYLAAGILALSISVGITSCGSDTSFVQYPDVEEEVPATSPFTLVDGGGNAVDNLSSEYGEYFIKVNAEGPWKLEVDKDFHYAPKAKVPTSYPSTWDAIGAKPGRGTSPCTSTEPLPATVKAPSHVLPAKRLHPIWKPLRK